MNPEGAVFASNLVSTFPHPTLFVLPLIVSIATELQLQRGTAPVANKYRVLLTTGQQGRKKKQGGQQTQKT
ncbi:hypothetical protein BXU06_10425 [Aquaspirillum sp. LM1]|nr:hypothetical protein BXU06_10425 [Aquaspirillum sp. LM1]